eukprot:TRINITY_DN1844_c0_g1_i4.p1 TRINITY_DN1844_c0_g1~~TRINITY_DN1844_c0_g1_i4.p1  ORF type:complete len:200 (+),score=50.46 TRINITY_DN1844_c0_g1_i4:66-665(+)
MCIRDRQQDVEIEKLSLHIEKLDSQVRELVASKRKAQAMTKLQEVKAKRNLLIKKENMRTMLVKTKLQVEMHLENQNIVETLREANTMMKDVDETNDDMIEQIEEMKQRTQEMQQADEYLNQMMQPDMEEKQELEDELAEIEKELKQQEAGKVMDQFANLPSTNANYQVPQQYQQQSYAPQSETSKTKFTSALEETLNI